MKCFKWKFCPKNEEIYYYELMSESEREARNELKYYPLTDWETNILNNTAPIILHEGQVVKYSEKVVSREMSTPADEWNL